MRIVAGATTRGEPMPRSTFDDPERELIKGRNFCHVATRNDDGSIHSTLV